MEGYGSRSHEWVSRPCKFYKQLTCLFTNFPKCIWSNVLGIVCDIHEVDIGKENGKTPYDRIKWTSSCLCKTLVGPELVSGRPRPRIYGVEGVGSLRYWDSEYKIWPKVLSGRPKSRSIGVTVD